MPERPTQVGSEIVLYQTEDGQSRIAVRREGDTVWLTQRQMAELFQKDVRTVSEHVQNIVDECEVDLAAAIRKFRIVQPEGRREVARAVAHRGPASLSRSTRRGAREQGPQPLVPRPCHSHGARHTAGGSYAVMGAGQKVIGALLGHSDSASTERYTRVAQSATAALVQARWLRLGGGEGGR